MKWLKSKAELLVEKWLDDPNEVNMMHIINSVNEDNVKDILKSIKGRMKTDYYNLEYLILRLADDELFSMALNNSKNISFIVDYNELFIKLYLKFKHSNHSIIEAFQHKYQPILDLFDGYFEHSYDKHQLDFINELNSIRLSLELLNNCLIYNKIGDREFSQNFNTCLVFYNKHKDNLESLNSTAIESRNKRNHSIEFSMECYKIAGLLDDYKDTFTPDELIYHQTSSLIHEIKNSLKEFEQLSLHLQQDEELQRVTEQSIQETRFDRSLQLEIPTKRSYDETTSSPSLELSSKQSFNFDRVPYNTSIPFNLIDNKMSTHTPAAFELTRHGKLSNESIDADNDIPTHSPIITQKSLQKRRQLDDVTDATDAMDRHPSSQSDDYYYPSSQIQDDDIDYDQNHEDDQVDEFDECSPYAGIVESTTPTQAHF